MTLTIKVGETYTGTIKVTEPDGDAVTVSLVGNKDENIIVDPIPFSVTKDINDPLGMAIIYLFTWNWTPTIADVGLHNLTKAAVDSYGARAEKSLVIFVEEGNIMAITWEVDLSIIQLSGSIVSITATRTDNDIANPSVWTYTLPNIDASTNGQVLIEVRDRVADIIWGAWLDHVARSTAIQGKKDTYESAIAAALQAKEI